MLSSLNGGWATGWLEFWHIHLPIFSIVLPAFTAFLLILLGYPSLDSNKHRRRLYGSRIIGLSATLLGLILSLDLMLEVNNGQIHHYYLGNWAAPFGIVLVLDRLSAMMVFVTYLLAFPVLWYATGGWDQKSRFFHTFFQFLLMGLCGAFLTGDLFNLFVFFEILLMASYVLLLHGHGRVRFRMGVHYVIINLVASAIFLIGLALVYGSVGSLNMVDVARILPSLPPDQHALAQTAGMLLLIVFGIKAAMLPLSFWLPNTYAAAATPVAALFAIMTKVGVYAILRVNGTIFVASGVEAGDYLNRWLLPIALLSTLFGAIGALAAHTLRRLAGYLLLSSVGTLLIGIATATASSWSAALYYLPHSTFAIASFYLLSEWISHQRSAVADTLHPTFAVQQPILLSILGLILMMLLAGLPPFSGFLGKLMLLQSVVTAQANIWIFATVLGVSLISLITLVRAGIMIFWQAEKPNDLIQAEYITREQVMPHRLPVGLFILLTWLAGLVIFAAPIKQYTDATALQLKNPTVYQQHILSYDQQGQVISTQPFDATYMPHVKNQQGTTVTGQTHHSHVIEQELPAKRQLTEQADMLDQPPQQGAFSRSTVTPQQNLVPVLPAQTTLNDSQPVRGAHE